ncbi:hypothetical protein D7I44_17490 [Gryllotalpicola protaetiae]|uniref:Uncharacterized protein n=1 Tax=Gryllotalpicola protaetiae TaxID=2419771 RepID=A0A387BR21_9MICO|nr:hypothetical protein D7I44_17490 [Gryllotalpicola protaetiae]
MPQSHCGRASGPANGASSRTHCAPTPGALGADGDCAGTRVAGRSDCSGQQVGRLTMVGFLRGESMNVYAGVERLRVPELSGTAG